MAIAGIDYSLTCPAICVFTGEQTDRFTYDKCLFYFLSDVRKHAKTVDTNIHGTFNSGFDEECQRYQSISEWAVDKVVGCEDVAIEGYAYNAKGRVFHIAENTGILKYKLWESGTPYTILPPSKPKKIATGKGNANKVDMYAAFKQETGQSLYGFFGINPVGNKVANPISDIVDAYYICKTFHMMRKKDGL